MELLRWIVLVGDKIVEPTNRVYLKGHFGRNSAIELKKYLKILEQYDKTFRMAINVMGFDVDSKLDFETIPYEELCYMIESIDNLDWENEVDDTTKIIIHGFTEEQYRLLYRLMTVLEQNKEIIQDWLEYHTYTPDPGPEELECLTDSFRIMDFMRRNWEEDMLPETYERMLRENFTQDDYVELANMLIVLDENNETMNELIQKVFE